MYGAANTGVEINAYDGGIKLTNSGNYQYIDFRNLSSEDFDARILYNGHELWFYTDGIGRYYIDHEGGHNA